MTRPPALHFNLEQRQAATEMARDLLKKINLKRPLGNTEVKQLTETFCEAYVARCGLPTPKPDNWQKLLEQNARLYLFKQARELRAERGIEPVDMEKNTRRATRARDDFWLALDRPLRARLSLQAEKDGLSNAELVRRAVQEYLDRRAPRPEPAPVPVKPRRRKMP